MEYKDTLNLPRTDFAMKADLVTREPERLKKWEAANLYAKIQAARANAEKFVLHDGPPFANGDVHIGTALNKILKDIIIKYKTLRGFSAPYIPGWDCHGLPIEFKVTQEMRKALMKSARELTEQEVRQAGENLSPEAAEAMIGRFVEVQGDRGAEMIMSMLPPTEIRQACETYALKYVREQRTQFKRLGVLGDWENPYLTLNKEYEADELRLFADIVEKGFVYRGKKPVYWSIPCRTALAEAEVEYADHVSQSVFVKFPVVGRPGVNIVIWTTTPWTLPANLAVAYNSTFSYSLVQVGEEQFIVSAMLLSVVAGKCGWQDYQIVRSLDGEHLKSLEYQHPFCNRTGKLFSGDNFVTNDTGTGFVHIAPGHGLDDYNIGRQNGLPIYSPVNDDGALAYSNELPVEQQLPAEMLGKSILEKHGKSDANEAVLHELRVRKALLHQENYHHSYPHCWRSKTPVIFRAMDQWFIKVDHEMDEFKEHAKRRLQPDETGMSPGILYSDFESQLKAGRGTGTLRTRALAAVEHEVNWIPDWGKNRIAGAVDSRPDWCISRQRTWGVPIPAFYDAKGEPILDADIVRNAAKLIDEHGSNVWFEKSASELWSLVKPQDWKGAEAAAKSNDTLDVWIDSGSSSRAVIARRKEISGKEKPFQADMYLEGSDQHRGWFQSSLLLSLAGNGAAPFKTVLTHGFMVDADREKISKSKQGGYEKPQTAEAYVKKYGADVVRLWVASQDFRNDIVVSEERINKVGETYRGIRNALRYQLSNLFDFDPAKYTVAEDQLTSLDRWILGEFSRIEADVITAYDNSEFHVVYQKLSQFVAVELSSIYHDVIKDRMYTDAANSPRRRSTQTALHRLVTGLSQMLSPILVFTADEAWEFIPGRPANSVHLAGWKAGGLTRRDTEVESWKNLFLLRELALPELEKARQAKQIGKSLEAKVVVNGSGPLALDAKLNLDSLRELLNVSQVELTNGGGETVFATVTRADGQKCERCWHWETDVGSHASHPTLCGRCVDAVKEFKA
ncbi:MAG: isoleucine--tRNA ligase [Verrucomicrobia bacterium]|nr:isoleucine--tRNA ligase [Verrucomicrobiota bacterium]